jgi:hypothetical protein
MSSTTAFSLMNVSVSSAKDTALRRRADSFACLFQGTGMSSAEEDCAECEAHEQESSPARHELFGWLTWDC